MPWSSNSCRSYWFRQGSFLRPLVVVVFRRRAMVREMHAAHAWSYPCASSVPKTTVVGVQECCCRFLCVDIDRKGSSMHGRHGRKCVPENCVYRRRRRRRTSPPRRRKRQTLFAVTTTGGCMHACMHAYCCWHWQLQFFKMVAVCRATDENGEMIVRQGLVVLPLRCCRCMLG